MAVISPTVAYDAGTGPFERQGLLVSWAQINEDDQGGPARIPLAHHRKTVTFTGTFHASTAVALQFSLDGANWHTAKDVSGADIATDAAASFEVLTNAPFWQVFMDSPGGSADVDVFMTAVAG